LSRHCVSSYGTELHLSYSRGARLSSSDYKSVRNPTEMHTDPIAMAQATAVTLGRAN